MARTGQVKVTINAKRLLEEMTSDSAQLIALELRKEIEPKLEKAQRELQAKFSAHPVTREIDGGTDASNISGTLGGYGNLFSFMGFEAGDFPTAAINEILNQNMKFSVRKISGTTKYKMQVFAPTKAEIYDSTPLPWASNLSWADGVEKGISGLGYYLFSTKGMPNSRSGTAIQSVNRISGVNFTSTPYVGKMLETFEKRISKLEF